MRMTASLIGVCPLLAAGLVLAVTPPAAAAGKKYAVLVGVQRYDHGKLEPLEFTENDVTKLAGLLGPAGYQVTLLTDTTGAKDATLAPTRDNIQKQLKSVLNQTKRDDLVLVAFAGHGLQFEAKQTAYFCPRDARPAAVGDNKLISLES